MTFHFAQTLNQAKSISGNEIAFILVVSVFCLIGIYYGGWMFFRPNKYLEDKENYLEWALFGGFKNIAPRQRRIARLWLWKKRNPPDQRRNTQIIGGFVLASSVLVELLLLKLVLFDKVLQ
ncbi:hypothetical protein [Geothrix rubra]|uniref:hypothetical protein n=1 Tax=Geothrix rubra TaxID=2927977 RepID=UPI002553B8D7|nr:hypothetical protein [Geothrix rubra]